MPLDRLPTEIIDAINEHLDSESIKNFRLTSKSAAQKCLNPRFISLSSQARTDFTPDSLQNLHSRASHPVFRNAARCLIVQVIVYDHRGVCPKRTKLEIFYGTRDPWGIQWLDKIQQERDSLSDEFVIDSLATTLDSFPSLDEIRFDPRVLIAPGVSRLLLIPSHEFPWMSHVVFIVLAAVARSSTPLRKLDIYNGCRFGCPWLSRHSVSASEFAFYIKRIKAEKPARRSLPIEVLGLTVSNISSEDWSRAGNQTSLRASRAVSPSNDGHELNGFSGVQQLLQLTSKLVSLHLTFDFEMEENTRGPEDPYKIFKSIADDVHLPRLKHFYLTNFSVTGNSLLKFLGSHPQIISLDIWRASIPEEERWNPTLRYINTNMPALRSVGLSALRKGDRFCELNPRPHMRLNTLGDWNLGFDTCTHRCPLDCDSWPRAHKYLGRLSSTDVNSRFVYSRFGIFWNCDPPEGRMVEGMVEGNMANDFWYVLFHLPGRGHMLT